jgi:phospholipase C
MPKYHSAACRYLAAVLIVCALGRPALAQETRTPIRHLIVLFQENISFDHYFATYPVALNPAGEPPFTAAAGTAAVYGLRLSPEIRTGPIPFACRAAWRLPAG